MAQRKREERTKERDKEKPDPLSPVRKETPAEISWPISLVVSPSAQDLAGRGYLSQTLMNQLLLQTGDLLLLQPVNAADHVAGAVIQIWPTPANSTAPRNHLILDSLTCENCSVAPGETVRIDKTSAVDAAECDLEPVGTASAQLSFSYATPIILQALASKCFLPGNFASVRIYGRTTKLLLRHITSKTPSAALRTPFCFSASTRLSLSPHPTSSTALALAVSAPPPVSQPTVSIPGGLDEQIAVLEELVTLPMRHPELESKYGIKPARGVLLYGPPGTGKTLLARYIAAKTGAHLTVINGPDIVSKFFGETESKLREIFAEARSKAPAIVFIDEIDALCPKRDEAQGSMERRVVGTLLTEMDGMLHAGRGVVVIAATNRRNYLDEALRRPGRLDRELEVPPPNATARATILRSLFGRMRHTLSDGEVSALAAKLHGFVGADLESLCQEAALRAVRRWKKSHEKELSEALEALTAGGGGQQVAVPRTDDVSVTKDDVDEALAEVRPSALREVVLEISPVSWDDIGGQGAVKQRLKEAVEWPLRHPEAFTRMGIRPPRGVLLYGPPGCSKTLTARALATMSGYNFIAVKGPELLSKWVGDSERAVKEVFRKARATAPAVIFFDEIDALAGRRGGSSDEGSSATDRVLSQLLTEMDGIVSNTAAEQLLVMAATNRPDLLDDALLRPGRIDRILYVAPPDAAARVEIFRIHTRRQPTSLSDDDLAQLAKEAEGLSGAEIAAVCREAALTALREDLSATAVQLRHYSSALKKQTPQITEETLSFYRRFEERTKLQSL